MNKINVTPKNIEKIETLPHNWGEEDYKQIIDKLGLSDDGMKGQELIDFAYMAIADEELNDSAKILLEYLLSDELNSGQIDNLSHEFADDKMWEEYPDINLHKDIYKINQLLYKAYNGKVPHGYAYKLTLEISSKSHEILELISSHNPDIILKSVIAGTEEHSLLHRMFDDIAANGQILEASGILWDINKTRSIDHGIEVEVISSAYWFEDYIADIPYEVDIDLEHYVTEEEEN